MDVKFSEGDRVLLPATTPESPWYDGVDEPAQRATVLEVADDLMTVEIDPADRLPDDHDGIIEFEISTVKPDLLSRDTPVAYRPMRPRFVR